MISFQYRDGVVLDDLSDCRTFIQTLLSKHSKHFKRHKTVSNDVYQVQLMPSILVYEMNQSALIQIQSLKKRTESPDGKVPQD